MQGEFPYLALPVLFVGDEALAQSNAILRYSGKLTGMYPSDILEGGKVDELLDATDDFALALRPSFVEKDAKKKEKIQKEMLENVAKWMNLLEKRVATAGGGFSVGDRMSISDLKLTVFLNRLSSTYSTLKPDLIQGFPLLNNIVHQVNNHSKIKEWKEKHNSK